MAAQTSDGTTKCAACGASEWGEPHKPFEKSNVVIRCGNCGALAIYQTTRQESVADSKALYAAQRPRRGPVEHDRYVQFNQGLEPVKIRPLRAWGVER
jgi:hypothetical protein